MNISKQLPTVTDTPGSVNSFTDNSHDLINRIVTDNLDIWTTAITKRSATGRGSNKKIELTGIKKLRELILELAVRGKLVPQDPNDEPASVLLEKIAAEKEQLIKDKKIKKTKVLPDIGEDEKPFELPSGWEWMRLGETTNYGSSDKVEAKNTAPNTWVLELEDVEKNTSKLLKKVRFIDRQFKSSKNKFSKDDVIYGKLRPYLDKVLVADEDGICTTEMIPLKAYSSVAPKFLRLLMKSPYFISYANNSTHGMNLPRMGTDKARLAILPLVPELEQHRIVAKVDELMLLCDQLEQQTEDSITAHQTLVETLLATLSNSETPAAFNQNWTRIAAHFDTLFTTEHSIDQLKQTILQLAVMGKLVPQDPNDQPASVLLEKIAAEKEQLIKDKKIKKQKPLPAITEGEKPFVLPDGWEWSDLQHLITIMDAGWSPACPPDPSPSNEKWGVLKTTAVQSMEYREYENKILAESKDPKPQYEVKTGDILITRAGPKKRVGVSCLVQSTRPKLMISDEIIRFHLVEAGMCERYISLCLNAGVTAEYLEKAKSGMAESQMNISQDKLKVAPIPLCAVNEQHRIVKKVDELMTLCDQLKARINDVQATQLHLADAIVKQAVN